MKMKYTERSSILCVLLIAAAGCSGGAGEASDGSNAPGAAAAAIGAWGIDMSARDEAVAAGDDFNRYANGRWLD